MGLTQGFIVAWSQIDKNTDMIKSTQYHYSDKTGEILKDNKIEEMNILRIMH